MERNPDATRGALSLAGTFAERLYQARRARNMNQSDLARLVWGEKEDARGYMTANNRTMIGFYEKGQTRPRTDTLEKLANALGVAPEDLAPEIMAGEDERRRMASGGGKDLVLEVVDAKQNLARLAMDVIVPLSVATVILGHLQDCGAVGAGIEGIL